MLAENYIPVALHVLGHRSCFDRASFVWIYAALMLMEITECWMNVSSDSSIGGILANVTVLIQWLCLCK